MAGMREIVPPVIVARPSGTRVRTRLRVSDADAGVLWQVGMHLGLLAGRDLARRCADGRVLDRAARKRELTGSSSSRWAGAITRTSNDQWARERANQGEQARSLRAALATIDARLRAPVGGQHEVNGRRVRGYRTAGERWQKQRRRAVLASRLARLETDLAAGRVSVVRGGTALAKQRHNLVQAGMTVDRWRDGWDAARLFLCADGEADKRLGNETIRWDPDTNTLEVRLPTPLAHLSNTPGRAPVYRLSCQVAFPHRGGEVAAQTVSGAVRYDINFDPDRRRWYLDASWTIDPQPAPAPDLLRQQRTFAVDLNADHVAGWVIDPAGNPVGTPVRFAVPATGSRSQRDAQVRHMVTRILRHALNHGCRSVTIENLNFTAVVSRDAATAPRGRRGRRLRATVAGIPTGRFRHRLTQMAANLGLWVIAVDPAYTSRWGRQIVGQLDVQTPDHVAVSVHDGAAVMIGRRGLGHDHVPVPRTPGPPPADDGRATADTHRARPREPRQHATDQEPAIVTRQRRRGTQTTDVARSRQHRSGGTSTRPRPG